MARSPRLRLPDRVTFTSLTWATAQTVTLTAVEDADALDEVQTTLTHTADGADYPGSSGGSVTADLTVTVMDNDIVGLTLTPTMLTLDEGADDHLYRGARYRADGHGDGDHPPGWRGHHDSGYP